MSTQPLVSIVIPTYNSAGFLGYTIGSAVQQTYPNWDMWIVDDGSTDNTEQVVQPYLKAYPNIHYTKLEKNSGGAAVPRNVALKQTNASLIAFLDADDMFMPTKLQEQVPFMRDRRAAISYTGYRRITPDGGKTGHLIHVPEQLDYKRYANNTCITLSTSMVNREETGDIEFSDKYRGKEDCLLWYDLLHTFEAYGLNKDLARYRRGHETLSSNIFQAAKANWEIYHKEMLDLTEFERLTSFGGYVINAVKKRLLF